MSTHNIVHASIECPRCKSTSSLAIEGFFGFGRLDDYKVGDEVRWVPRKAPQHGGRPADGATDAEGYAICPACGRDFFVKILIRADKITGVVVDASRAGHMP